MARKTLKIRINTALTDEQVGEGFRSIEAMGGYCPCVGIKKPQYKCHCLAFRRSRVAGPCPCGIFEKYEVGGK